MRACVCVYKYELFIEVFVKVSARQCRYTVVFNSYNIQPKILFLLFLIISLLFLPRPLRPLTFGHRATIGECRAAYSLFKFHSIVALQCTGVSLQIYIIQKKKKNLLEHLQSFSPIERFKRINEERASVMVILQQYHRGSLSGLIKKIKKWDLITSPRQRRARKI